MLTASIVLFCTLRSAGSSWQSAFSVARSLGRLLRWGTEFSLQRRSCWGCRWRSRPASLRLSTVSPFWFWPLWEDSSFAFICVANLILGWPWCCMHCSPSLGSAASCSLCCTDASRDAERGACAPRSGSLLLQGRVIIVANSRFAEPSANIDFTSRSSDTVGSPASVLATRDCRRSPIRPGPGAPRPSCLWILGAGAVGS